MIFYAVSLLFFILHFITNLTEASGIFIFLGSVPLAISIMCNICHYYCQGNDIERIVEQGELRLIEEKEANSLIDDLRTHLTENFPKFEKEIFDKIKPQNVSIYLTKYPELRTNETIIKYIENIKRFQRRIFDCDRIIATLNKNIRMRKRTIMLFCLPILPKK